MLTLVVEFTEHQRSVFCVFSGNGVSRLREHLNSAPEYSGLRVSREAIRRGRHTRGYYPTVLEDGPGLLGAAVDGDLDEYLGDDVDGVDGIDGNEMALDTQPLLGLHGSPHHARVPPPGNGDIQLPLATSEYWPVVFGMSPENAPSPQPTSAYYPAPHPPPPPPPPAPSHPNWPGTFARASSASHAGPSGQGASVAGLGVHLNGTLVPGGASTATAAVTVPTTLPASGEQRSGTPDSDIS